MSKDIRRMVQEIRGALDAYPREQLQEILAYVFKEYVVEGTAPATGAMAMLEARTELEGLSFAELVTWLQLHLDVPELGQLEVQNGRVFVRAGGRAIAIEAARAAEPPAQSSAPAPAPSNASAPSPSNASAPSPSNASAPPPATPRTGAVVPPPQPTPPQPASAPTPPTQPQPPANPTPGAPQGAQNAGDKKEEPSPASRFSWLEVD